MNSNEILQADVLDIIFLNRNKSYGAYRLRKFYPERIKMALALVLVLSSLFSMLVLLPAGAGQRYAKAVPHETKLLQLPVEKPEQAKPQQQHHLPPGSKRAYTNRVLITDKKDSANIIEDFTSRYIVSPGYTGEGDIPFIEDAQLVQEVPVSTGPAKIKTEEPVNDPEVQPMYPGGMVAFRRFLEQHLKTPDDIHAGTAVQVRIKCVIGYDGQLRNFEVLQDGGKPFNEEVIRVLKKMPRWIPGKSNGMDVAAYHIIPVKFVNWDE
ncbi:MAG TPA: energy transducer TonB [Ferruginibacter sp.]|nr:energy transducer TonB [Ferruginibacter sp.]HMP21325.1 energy transducer TonB [Ferruginibacter sp.]